MPHWTPRLGYTRTVSQARTTSGVSFTTVTGSGTAHVKGAWSQLVASTAGESHLMKLFVVSTQTSTANSATLMDIGIGGAGSEKVIVPNLGVGFALLALTSGSAQAGAEYTIPVQIPSGTRVAARLQALRTAPQTASVAMDLMGGQPPGGFPSGAAVDTYGADTATSNGVVLTGAAVAPTKGAWSEIVASTPNAIKGLMISPQGNTGILASVSSVIDIGVGAAGSEIVVVPDIVVVCGTAEFLVVMDRGMFPLDIPIPAGSRIAARIGASAGVLYAEQSLIVHGVR